MTDDVRVRHLVEEILESQRTPEEVCSESPDLLPAVRRRLEQVHSINYRLDEMFGDTDPTAVSSLNELELPVITGYEVESILGRGGMGVVFKARHVRLNRIVALKMLLVGAYAGTEERTRFRREAEAVAALKHPNIVPVYDAGDFTGRPYFTMEYVAGGTLAQALATNPLPPRRAAELIAILASAVQFAHQSGFIHRDLKPVNILLTADGVPKITDFGLARSISAGRELTLSGAPIGTPTYMAPEQASGNVGAIGPAADIYALGAILYEMLMGRPPLEGQTATETIQKVIAEEPAAPSSLNSRVPRDLETICLKCLQKNPARRYASAQDLADDLHRFLDGKPVIARPVGMVERAVKWTRRRPTFALFIAGAALMVTVALAAGIWIHQREAANQAEKIRRQENARQAIEIGVSDAYRLTIMEQFTQAEKIFAECRKHLDDANSNSDRERIAHAEAECKFTQELLRIHQIGVDAAARRATLKIEPVDHEQMVDQYARAFAGHGIKVDADPQRAAEQIRGMPLASQIVMALDYWALATFILSRGAEHQNLLHLAKLADPDPTWRDRLRTTSTWTNKKELRTLAREALASPRLPSPHHLEIVARLLGVLGARNEGIELLRSARARQPGDYWLNRITAAAFHADGRHKEALPALHIMAAQRPGNAWTLNYLGTGLLLAGEYDEAIDVLRRAVALEPRHNGPLATLAEALRKTGQWQAALKEFRKFAEAEPDSAVAAHSYGRALFHMNRFEQAAVWYRKAVQLDPKFVAAHLELGSALLKTPRLEEASTAFREVCRLDPSNVTGHYNLGVALHGARKYQAALAEFDWVIRELDSNPKRKEADRAEPFSCYNRACMGRAQVLLCLGRFAEAELAQEPRGRDLCRKLRPLEGRLAALLNGDEMPADTSTQLALAEWCALHGRRLAAAVRLYDAVFTKQAAIADDVKAQHRRLAALAAARAGCGQGDDSARLDEIARSTLRKQGLQWLRADLAAWTQRVQQAKPVGSNPSRMVHAWQKDDAFACVRDEARIAKFPEEERASWQRFWADVQNLAWRDVGVNFDMAHAYVERGEWLKASECYDRCVKTGYENSAHVQFERAATKLLSGNRKAYQQLCEKMLNSPITNDFRSFHVARTVTLAPASLADLSVAAKKSASELKDNANAHWSLTQKGSLMCRRGQGKDAAAWLQQSLRAEPRPGAAVVNWLWLAQCDEQMGDRDGARVWFNKAASWLDGVGGEMPPNAAAIGLDHHNWLEAHVLRREVETRLANGG